MSMPGSLSGRAVPVVSAPDSGALDSGAAGPRGEQPTLRLATIVLTALLSLGCAKAAPTGPLFGGPDPPGEGTARVYLYRVDTHHSFSTVEIRFDGQRPFPILDEEYATLELEDGIHAVEFRLSNAIWGGWRWRRQVLHASAGETIYMQVGVGVGVGEQRTANGSDLEIAGRGSGTAGESVTLQLRERRDALEQLSRSHRIEPVRR